MKRNGEVIMKEKLEEMEKYSNYQVFGVKYKMWELKL